MLNVRQFNELLRLRGDLEPDAALSSAALELRSELDDLLLAEDGRIHSRLADLRAILPELPAGVGAESRREDLARFEQRLARRILRLLEALAPDVEGLDSPIRQARRLSRAPADASGDAAALVNALARASDRRISRAARVIAAAGGAAVILSFVSDVDGKPSGGAESQALQERTSDFEQLTDERRSQLGRGAEALLRVASEFIDRQEPSEEAAIAESLSMALQAELRNPRPDIITLERLASRLAHEIGRSTDLVAEISRFNAEAEADLPAEQLASILETVLKPELGHVDDGEDREAAQATVDAVAQAIDRLISSGEAPKRTEDRTRGGAINWQQIAAVIVANRVVDWVPGFLSELGVWSTAAGAVIWVLIAIYQIGSG